MKLKINIDGKQYEAEIEVLEEERAESVGGATPRPAPKRSPAASSPQLPDNLSGTSGADGNVCKSSIVGIVVKLVASAGQTVALGETLLVLEAMKMESNVVSPASGVVKSIVVAVGDSVKKGQVLVEFE
jgi:methylmalonyl-CoA carboxyltransferase small subunit